MEALKKYLETPEAVEKEEKEFIDIVKKTEGRNTDEVKKVLPAIYEKVGKKGKKVIKKAIHILRTKGIEVQLPENIEGWSLPVTAEKKALFSSFTPTGERLLCGYVKKGKEAYTAVLVIHFLKGITQPSVGERVATNPIPILKEKWKEGGLESYELPYEHFVYSVKKAIERGEKKTLPLFMSEKDLQDIESYDPSTLVELPPLEVISTRSIITLLKEVHPYLPSAVLLPSELLKKYLDEYFRIKESPLIVSRELQSERIDELIKKVANDVLSDKVMDAYADFFFDSALIALKTSHLEGARILKWLGTSIREALKDPLKIPAMREIITSSFVVHGEGEKEENLIIKP